MGKVYFVRTAIFHIYPSVGYRVVYFSQGHTTTSYLINEIQLHTFFLYITHYRGTDSKIGNFMFNQINLTMKKLFVLPRCRSRQFFRRAATTTTTRRFGAAWMTSKTASNSSKRSAGN